MKYIIFVLSILFANQSQSQISLANIRPIGTFTTTPMLPIPEGGFLAIKKTDASLKGKGWFTHRHIISIFKYDKEFKLVKEIKMSDGANIYSGRFAEIKNVGSKFFFVYLEGQNNESMGDIKAVEIDPINFTLSQPKIIIPKTSLNHTISNPRMSYDLGFLSNESASGKYFSIYVRMSSSEFYLSSIDENLNQQFGKKERLDGLQKKGICSFEVDDAGNIYLGYYKKSGPAYTIYTKVGKMDHVVNPDDIDAKEILFKPSKNNEVSVYGTYHEGENSVGVYNGVLNTQGQVTSITKTKFPDFILETLKKEGWSSTKSSKVGIHPFFTAELKELGNGKTTMILEFHKIAGGPNSEYFHGGSLLSIFFGGTTTTFARVPKYHLQGAGGDVSYYGIDLNFPGGRFFYPYVYASGLIFFYYDHPENRLRDISLDAKIANPSNQILVAAVVSDDGTVIRQAVYVQPLNGQLLAVPEGGIRIPLPLYNLDIRQQADAWIQVKL